MSDLLLVIYIRFFYSANPSLSESLFLFFYLRDTVMRKAYPDDLTDDEWAIVEPFTSKEEIKPWGGKPKHSKREILNAILYLLRTGCQRRHLPHDF
ncbi:Transposase, IS5 family, OrfA, partial [Parachlamydia acanthamoebae]